MTAYYIHPKLYICDGCKLREVWWDHALPEGWHQPDPARYPHGTSHYCPKCSAPEAK